MPFCQTAVQPKIGQHFGLQWAHTRTCLFAFRWEPIQGSRFSLHPHQPAPHSPLSSSSHPPVPPGHRPRLLGPIPHVRPLAPPRAGKRARERPPARASGHAGNPMEDARKPDVETYHFFLTQRVFVRSLILKERGKEGLYYQPCYPFALKPS